MLPLAEYKTEVHNDWCPGCGDFGVLASLQMALRELEIPPHKAVVYSGIGCSGKTPHYINAYGFHTLHGRVLPMATGAKLASPDITVIAVGGDGDGLGIGAGHFVGAGRRNLDITYMIHDNGVYGLTKGQASPTMPKGTQTKSLPEKQVPEGVNPIALALACGYTFVARGYALDPKGLKELLMRAVQHKGSAFIDAIQTCPTYNDVHTKEFYGPRVHYIEKDGYDGVVKDPNDEVEVVAKRTQAFQAAYPTKDKVPLGVFFQVQFATMEETLTQRVPTLFEKPLAATESLYGRTVAPLFATMG